HVTLLSFVTESSGDARHSNRPLASVRPADTHDDYYSIPSESQSLSLNIIRFRSEREPTPYDWNRLSLQW
ncbi:MAG: hypothetical protein KAQ74_01500, partial [Dehalococcoidia bacterium]|nr:hypothetical protein [Dehalococcoidia bacterium]